MSVADFFPAVITFIACGTIVGTALLVMTIRHRVRFARDPEYRAECKARESWLNWDRGSYHFDDGRREEIPSRVGWTTFVEVVGADTHRSDFVRSSLLENFARYLHTSEDLRAALHLFHQPWGSTLATGSPSDVIVSKRYCALVDRGERFEAVMQQFSFHEFAEAVVLLGEDAPWFTKHILPVAVRMNNETRASIWSAAFRTMLEEAIQTVGNQLEQELKNRIAKLQKDIATEGETVDGPTFWVDNGMGPREYAEQVPNPQINELEDVRKELDALPDLLLRIRGIIDEQWKHSSEQILFSA